MSYDLSRALADLSKVFENDHETQEMSDHDRLQYHKEHSKPILDALKIWMYEQFKQKNVKPNFHLAEVLMYRLKHWHKLIGFLTVEIYPVSKNRPERTLKIIIRIIK